MSLDPSAVSVDGDLLADDTIDEPAGLKERLPIFLVSQCTELLRLRAAGLHPALSADF
jgi:hypothetical protein